MIGLIALPFVLLVIMCCDPLYILQIEAQYFTMPVLANFDVNELKTIVDENQCGVFTKARDKDAFKQAIMNLYNDRERCKQLGRNGSEFILKNLTRAVGTQKYVDVIKSFDKNQEELDDK